MEIVDAKALVKRKLAEMVSQDESVEFVLVEDATIEKEWGWVFFYQNKKYIETGEVKYALAGNAPYIVNRNTSEIISTGTAHNIEYYINEYEQTL